MPTVEWLRVDGGRIVSVHLFFDRVSFNPASEEVARRVPKGAIERETAARH